MRILHIANNDKGGAANAMLTLHDSLLSSGIDSKVLVLHKYNNRDSVYEFLQNRRLFQKLKDSISYRLFDFKRQCHRWIYHIDYNFTYFKGPYNIHEHSLANWADIIHMHWYHNFVDLPKLFDDFSKPIVFTLHDENLFLGGFHYSFDRNAANKKSWTLDGHYHFQKQNLLLQKKNLHFVAPSKWLYSLLGENHYRNIYHIPYAVDNLKFKPIDRSLARKKMGIGNDLKVFLLLADHLESKRKGALEAIKAFVKVSPKKSKLLIAGNCDELITHPDVQYLGYMSGADALCSIYSAADATVVPSLADNLPNTVLESLACGTPVIGFNTGGMSDMINNNVNGILLEPRNFKSLFNDQLFSVLQSIDREIIRQSITKGYSPLEQIKSYMQLYKEITH